MCISPSLKQNSCFHFGYRTIHSLHGSGLCTAPGHGVTLSNQSLFIRPRCKLCNVLHARLASEHDILEVTVPFFPQAIDHGPVGL